MPNYKKHLFCGFLTYSFLLYFLTNFKISIIKALQHLLCCLFGSLFPDIDTKSKIQKLSYVILLIVFIFLTILNYNFLLIIFSFTSFIPLVVKHRGIFHKFWFILLISLIISIICNIYFPKYINIIITNIFFFLAGALSHLILDLGIKRTFRI